MCLPALAALPALFTAGAGAAGAAGTVAGVGGAIASGLTAAGVTASTAATIGTVANVAIAIGSTALSVMGTISQANQQKDMLDYNARLQQLQAVDAERRGSIEEGRQRARTALLIGQARAQQGTSGVIGDESTGEDILAQTAEYGVRDAVQHRVNAAREAWGHRAQAGIYNFQGDQIMSNLPMKVGATALTSFSNSLATNPWWKSWQNDSTYAPGTYMYPASPFQS